MIRMPVAGQFSVSPFLLFTEELITALVSCEISETSGRIDVCMIVAQQKGVLC